MAVCIIPQIIRGRLFYGVSDVLFPTFAQAAGAWPAALAHRFDAVYAGLQAIPTAPDEIAGGVRHAVHVVSDTLLVQA